MGNDNGNKSAIKEHNPAFFWLPTLQTPPICMRNIQGRHRHRPRLTIWLNTRNTNGDLQKKSNLKKIFSVFEFPEQKGSAGKTLNEGNSGRSFCSCNGEISAPFLGHY